MFQGGLLGWHRDAWSASGVSVASFSITTHLSAVGSQLTWLITVVYRPQSDADKEAFLEELTTIKNNNPGPWKICGDFNMIYQACDKEQ